jgi:hypothetical protein
MYVPVCVCVCVCVCERECVCVCACVCVTTSLEQAVNSRPLVSYTKGVGRRGVTGMLQGCRVVSTLQGCCCIVVGWYKGVTRVSQGCHTCQSMTIPGPPFCDERETLNAAKERKRVLQGCYKNATRVSQRCYKTCQQLLVPPLMHLEWCYSGVTRVI